MYITLWHYGHTAYIHARYILKHSLCIWDKPQLSLQPLNLGIPSPLQDAVWASFCNLLVAIPWPCWDLLLGRLGCVFQALPPSSPKLSLPRLRRCTFWMAPASWPRCGSLPSPTLRVAQDNRAACGTTSQYTLWEFHRKTRKNTLFCIEKSSINGSCSITLSNYWRDTGAPEGNFHFCTCSLRKMDAILVELVRLCCEARGNSQW